MANLTLIAISALAIDLALALPASAQEHHHAQAGHKALGEVHFETSCNPQAQRHFNQAMLYQHSFWYSAARQAFEETLKADASCAIAYWGIGQSLLLNPFGPTPPKNLAEGLAALEKAESLGAKTPREQDYIGALKVFYKDHDKLDHRTRVQAYLKAMEDVARSYPDDDEAQIYLALALNLAASPKDQTYALPLRAAAILEPIFKRKPRHPGVAHYLVHSYDFPGIAAKGIDAAKRYAQIAGASPHALHMPSHIFTRVGLWKESIASNLASAKVAKQDKEPDDQLHAMDYLVYAYLQVAQDDKARAVLDEMNAITGVNAARHTGPFALAASAARYMVERGDWKGAAELPVRPSRFAHVDAMTHFARALGAARSGNPDGAKAEIAKLAELRVKLAQARDGYWAEQVDIQWKASTAWLLHAEGRHDEALAAMLAAADAEDRTEKHVVTPGPLAPARELYGAMLVERGLLRQALAAFEATLAKEPNRLSTTLAAAKAAETAGDKAQAQKHYVKAVSLADGSGNSRTEIVNARAFIRKHAK
jgi:hypothetical protein